MLPPNVLRPTPDRYESAWGGMVTPAGYGGRVLEIGQHFSLRQIGASIGSLAPGCRACPLHYHVVEEELFFVLDGEVTIRELRPDDEHYTEYPLRPGELAAYPPNTRIAHHSHNRTDRPVRYLGLSSPERAPGEIAVYPDSGKTLLRGFQIGVLTEGLDPETHIVAANERARDRAVQTLSITDRPDWVQTAERLEERLLREGLFGRPLSRAAGAKQLFANLDRLEAGAISSPLHYHSQDEELLLVLSGAPLLRQIRNGQEEQIQLQPDDLVAWRAEDQIAHQLLSPEGPSTYLIVGTARRDDVLVFPETNQMFVRALGERGIHHRTGYFDGER